MGRSRMKSDETTKSAGYCSVLGFNLRQLTRHVTGVLRQKHKDTVKVAANDERIATKTAIQ